MKGRDDGGHSASEIRHRGWRTSQVLVQVKAFFRDLVCM